MIEFSGVQFEAASGGGLILRLRHQATDNSEIVRIVQLDVVQVLDIMNELGYKFKSPVEEPVEPEPPAAEPTATVSDSVAHTVSDIIGN